MEKVNRLYEKIRLEALRQDELMRKALKQDKRGTEAIHREIKLALERIVE